MSVPRMNADEARGFQLACDAMALEGRDLQKRQAPDSPPLTATEACNITGDHLCQFARHLENILIKQTTP